MGRWWSRKYNLPSNHELFQQETELYWLTEYYVDHFEKNPLEVYKTDDGEYQFTDTGDELIDEWEEQIAQGEIPDLTQAFSKEALQKLKNRKKNVADHLFGSAGGSIGDTTAFFENERQKNEAEYKKRTEPLGPTFGRGR